MNNGNNEELGKSEKQLKADFQHNEYLSGIEALSVERLTAAYSNGFFPWCKPDEPVKWWAPDHRMVLFPNQFHMSDSFRRVLKQFIFNSSCSIRIDTACRDVISMCAEVKRKRQSGTWIVPDIVSAYSKWHEEGKVHSFEVWRRHRLIGGIYGVGLGKIFFAESAFSTESNASKIALAALACFCIENEIHLIDSQVKTDHMMSMGAVEISKFDFESLLNQYVATQPVATWQFSPLLWRHLDFIAD